MSLEAYRPTPELVSHFNVSEVEVPEFRGPCGGVNMAIETTFEVLGIVSGREPVFANNNPVHNDLITEEFKKSGILIEPQISKIPDNSILIASAHGWPIEDINLAKAKDLLVIDTTCQLVNVVGRAAERAVENNNYIIYFGSKNHPEPKGILSRIPENNFSFIDVHKPAKFITPYVNDFYENNGINKLTNPIIVLNQTTLSTKGIIEKITELQLANPDLIIPEPEKGICYATDNRQKVLRDRLLGNQIKPIDALIVVGSENSHNSTELKNIGLNEAHIPSFLINSSNDIISDWFTTDIQRILITSGASALDVYLEDALKYFTNRNSKLTYPISAEKVLRINKLTGEKNLEDRFFVAPDLSLLWQRYNTNSN